MKEIINIINNTNKTFCAIPWVNVSTQTDGAVRLCCVSDEYIMKDEVTKFNLGYDTVTDIINSESIVEIRKKMLSGEKVKGCEGCYKNEQYGGKSYRNYYNDGYSKNIKFIKKLIQSINNNGKIEETVEYFDIRFGNLCNLHCRTCYPEASSQVNKDVIRLYPISDIGQFHNIADIDNEWYQTDIFHNNIQSQLHNLQRYYSNGGEPTIIDSNISILQSMVSEGVSKNITLMFNTNMTNTKKDFFELLPNFKQIRFMCSIDGFEAMQEYLRYPSKWQQIDSNLNKILSMYLPNVHLKVTPVISKINLEYITDLFDYLIMLMNKFNVLIEIFPMVLKDPVHMQFEYLPIEYKKKCKTKIEKWINDNNIANDKKYMELNNVLPGILNRCDTELEYHSNIKRFFQFNDILDKDRGQALKDINPALDAMRYK